MPTTFYDFNFLGTERLEGANRHLSDRFTAKSRTRIGLRLKISSNHIFSVRDIALQIGLRSIIANTNRAK